VAHRFKLSSENNVASQGYLESLQDIVD